jgi:hypothetical protein
MLYTLVGTNQTAREKAQAEMLKLGEPTHHLYAEHVAQTESFIEANSLFGEKIVVHLIQTLERAEGRDIIYELLPSMQESQNIFVLDEPFADANRVKKLEKFSKRLYDAREEKEKEASPFPLTNAFSRRDKKNAWLEWMAVRDELEPEAIQGALWWKFQTVWLDAKSGRLGKFLLQECEQIGGEILKSSIRAHRGELDLKQELERIVLSI